MENNFYLGSHCSMNSPEFYVGTVKEAISYGANAFMFYTGAPQNSFRKPISELKIEEGRKLLREHGFDESKIVVHAPYIINPANIGNPELYDMSIRFIKRELERAEAFNAKTLVLHPGAHVGQGKEVAIKAVANALDIIFLNENTHVKIALETMTGKGTEIGSSFEEIKQIIDLCKSKDRVGVCLDTCHISDAGYDINDVDGILDEFDRVIGLDKLLVIHINDSKNPKDAHKDRHENLGYGYVGFDTINKFVHHPKLKEVPKILETPYINGVAPYKKEIEMLRNNHFEDGWKERF